MARKKAICIILTFILVVCGLSGCGSTKTSSLELNLALGAAPTTADPQLQADTTSASVTSLFTAGLYEYDENGKIAPCLAEGFDLSEDGCTYTFHLKKDLKWSDGRPLTAQDFVFALRRFADPNVGSNSVYLITDCCTIKNAKEVSTGKKPINELGVSSPDKDTFVVELEEPCPFFCEMTSLGNFSPCNEEFYHSVGDDYAAQAKSILSCGPYIIDRYEPLPVQIHYTKNPYFCMADKIKVEGINLQVIEDNQQKMMCYETGLMDVVSVSGELAELHKDSPELHVFPSATTYCIDVNTRTCDALKNKNIRMALSKSIDREDITTNLMKSGFTALTRAIPTEFYYEQDGSDFAKDTDMYKAYAGYDPEEAQKLWKQGLSELGVSEISLNFLYSSTNSAQCEAIASYMEKNLPGLKIELLSKSMKDVIQAKSNGGYDLLFNGWAADYADPTSFLGQYISDATVVGYNNPDYDAVYKQTMSSEMAKDAGERNKLLHKLEDMVMEDAGIIPIFSKGENFMIREGVDGFLLTPHGDDYIVTGLTVKERR